jgi:N-methylhydantoinase A
MVAYGGAGPVHAVAVARELGIRKVVIPPYCGVFSALGMLLADAKDEYIISHIRPFDNAVAPEIEKLFAQMETDGMPKMLKAGFARDKVATRRALEMRYVGQEFTLIIDIPATSIADAMAGVRAKFNCDYEARYGHAFPELLPEIVSLRLQVFGLFNKPELNFVQPVQQGAGQSERRQVYFDEAGFVDCPIYKRVALPTNIVLDGPMIVEELSSTTLVWPGDRLHVDEHGNLVIDVGG